MRFFPLCLIWILPAIATLGATGKKISDYTETLTIGDAWIYEIAVPGVTNYKVTFGAMATNIAARSFIAASNSVVATVVNLNTNKADNNNGQVTNLTSRGLTLPALTAGRSLILNASGNVTNVSGTPDGTKYVRDDGTYAVPSGGGGAGSFAANSGQFSTNSQLTIKDGASMTNVVQKGLSYIAGIITEGSTNISAFYGSNYFAGRVQIASSSPGAGKVLTSDVDGNATWETPAGGGGDVTTAQLNTASNAVVVLSSNNVRVAAGTGVTVSSAGASGVQTFTVNAAVGTSTGTNFPPVVTAGTNITVGTGVRKSLLMSTNVSAGINFNGTELLGETVTLVVTNTSAAASNITINFFLDGAAATYYDAIVASNVTGFLVVSNSSKRMEFVYNGSFWRLEGFLAKEMELAVAGGLSLQTNSVTSIVTLSNSLAIQQLNNVGVGTPANGDILSWNAAMGRWTNGVVPGSDIVSNIVVSTTNNVLLDFGAANVFKLTLLTNWTETFTNVTSLTKRGYVYYQQDTNGARLLNRYSVHGGLLQTNATQNMQPTTNASALDLLELMPGFFTTNLIAWWPQDFQPRIKFTNSVHAFLNFIDTFNRSNADPMTTTASDGHSWTSGPGALAEPRIVSTMLFGNVGQTGARVLTPTLGGNHKASITLIGDTGHIGPMVRMQSTSDASGYFLITSDATHLTIYKLTDTGSLANVALFTSSATPPMGNGDTITLSANGTTLECFLNGVSYGSVVDATWSGGQPGVYMETDTASGGPFTASEQ